jgi:para-nitrobenzyl esterase
MPLLSGGTRDEASGGGAYLEVVEAPFTESAYQDLLTDSFDADATRVAAAYPPGDYHSPAVAEAAVATDRAWACPTLHGNQMLAQVTRTYAFEFADRTAPSPVPTLDGYPMGAAHAFELAYLFDLGGRHLLQTPAQERLADQMIGYWFTFAHAGNPNHPTGLPHWQPIRADDRVPYVQSLESSVSFPGPADLSARPPLRPLAHHAVHANDDIHAGHRMPATARMRWRSR